MVPPWYHNWVTRSFQLMFSPFFFLKTKKKSSLASLCFAMANRKFWALFVQEMMKKTLINGPLDWLSSLCMLFIICFYGLKQVQKVFVFFWLEWLSNKKKRIRKKSSTISACFLVWKSKPTLHIMANPLPPMSVRFYLTSKNMLLGMYEFSLPLT